jgi:pimeloyl-ACP methyl ester carboxylesterase
VQIAKHFGAKVTGVCSGPNVELVRALGADGVIDYTREDFTKSGNTHDLIFDVVGATTPTAARRHRSGVLDFSHWRKEDQGGAMAFFGVSRGAQQRLTREEHERALRVLRMILPMSMRKTGNFNDPAHWFERGEFDLGRITAPTLVIHPMDDTFVPLAHGQYTEARIPNARFASQEFGGHFVYVRDAVPREIRAFIDTYGRSP